MKRRILFIQNPGSSDILKKGIPQMIERYKAYFRSPVGGFWDDSEFIDVSKLNQGDVTIQSDFIFKLKEINAPDVEYSIIIFLGHGASLDHKDHIQLESGELASIDMLTKGLYSQPIKRTVLIDACRVGYISSPQGWILESKTFSGDSQFIGEECKEYYNSLLSKTNAHVDIIQSAQHGQKAYGTIAGTDFSVALIDMLYDNAKIWNALAMGDKYGKLSKCYTDIHTQVSAKLKYQTPEFLQDKQESPYPIYAVSRPVARRISQDDAQVTILND